MEEDAATQNRVGGILALIIIGLIIVGALQRWGAPIKPTVPGTTTPLPEEPQATTTEVVPVPAPLP